jgi:hypothetical protein
MDFITQYVTNKFQRNTTRLAKQTSNAIVSGSTTALGGTFILLNAQSVSGAPCRIRLYADSASMVTDAGRASSSFALNDSVALVADIVLSGSTVLNFNPPVIGNTFTGGQLWYNLSGSSFLPITASITSYPLRPVGDSTDGNSSIVIAGSNIPTAGNGVSGSVTTSKSFLILSGSATHTSRLRIYSKPYTDIPSGEMTRSFGVQPGDNSGLIADLMFDTASFQYPLVPILEGFTWSDNEYGTGTGQLGYILENLSGGVATITASLFTYSLED